MKKNLLFCLVAFTFLMPTDSLAATAQCSANTDASTCISASSCYWKAGWGTMAVGSCNSCPNTEKSYSGVTNTGIAYDSTNNYCQYVYGCSDSKSAIKATVSSGYTPLYNSLISTLTLKCEQCDTTSYKANYGVVII